ncbi:MAG: dTDP-glucose 4,6-dehydratase [Clostridia bacterium]|nr:dTDP-glucose 4,6-dehydratase [Clostridia bacterium]
MRVMVCGGAGFIGSHFIDYILNNYKEDFVLCYVKLTYAGKKENFSHNLSNKNFAFVQGDICNKQALLSAVEQFKIDTIVNFAAESHVDRSIVDSSDFLQTNIVGTATLLEVVKQKNLTRFHQVSTDEVYGDLEIESNLKFTESSPIAPSSAYSASKASADLLVLASRRTFNLPVTISRCGNNYGTRQHQEKFIPQMVLNAVNGNNLPVYGNGLNVRDWIHVYDHVLAIDLILRKGKVGEIYNVGANNTVNNITLAKRILSVLNLPEENICFVEDRKGHDRKYAVDYGKIQKELGINPTKDINKEFTACDLEYAKSFKS